MEEQHLQPDEKTNHTGKAYVPSKIRDIVTKSISSSDPKMSSGTISDEKRTLENEVSRLEDLLSSTRAERDEISSKYLAVSERVSMVINGNSSLAERVVYIKGVHCARHVFTLTYFCRFLLL